MHDEPIPIYDPECRARTLREPQDAALGFAICHTNPDVRRHCKAAFDLGFSIVLCRHPLYTEIVARTATADKPA